MALSGAARLQVDDATGVAPVRRAAERLAAGLGFDEHARGEVAIVVTELATNLVRHAGGGEIVLSPVAGDAAINVVAWDRGPGISDVAKARGDGFSTAGGAGTGLGAIGRLSADIDLQAAAGQGAVVAVRIGGDGLAADVDGLALALAGEEVSGDAWAQARDGDDLTIVLADGLGHGPEAARASLAATGQLRPGLDPTALLERMHGALRPTRGAAAAVARLNLRTGALRYAGIGNIAGTVIDGHATRSLASMNGTLGHRLLKIQAYDHQLGPGALLVLHSDGCRTGWELASYPGLLRRAPLVVASLLIRDFERGRDDVSVVVARVKAAA